MNVAGARSSIARHPHRAEIDRQLRAGVPSMTVARDHDLSRQAMDRYKTKLLARPAGKEDDERRAMRRQVQALYSSTIDLMTKAKDANAPRAFLAATAEARRCLGLMSKILGLLNEPAAAPVAVAVNVDIHELQQVILVALTPYPEARQACAAALIEYDDRKHSEEE